MSVWQWLSACEAVHHNWYEYFSTKAFFFTFSKHETSDIWPYLTCRKMLEMILKNGIKDKDN